MCNSLPAVLAFPQVHGSSDLPSRSASLFHLEGFNFAALGEDSGAEECAVQLLQVYALSFPSRSERQLREGSGVLHSVKFPREYRIEPPNINFFLHMHEKHAIATIGSEV
ncbi:hypothetical protein R1flu_020649 [Riccia fluitans]|uniref:Uncharacterized protein n=1 Tax=Riccia fluitans TaxID=41844 RepID=A0ABD1ZP75_9MARC